ncbi:MAG: FecR protein, partial [Proteobacteria bacterium]|nr:FecR protein [Pseudomonadota bacterium]
MIRRSVRVLAVTLLCAQLATGGAIAQPYDPTDPAADPPARVGRLSEVQGVVSFHAADQDQWSPAVPNYPVTAGNSFWTEPAARAALQLGPATIRMGSQTEFDVVALDEHNFQGQIGQGSINLRLHVLAPGDNYQIVTARGTVQITAPGRYHIDGGTDATPTRVAVFDGAAQFVGNNADLVVRPGETAQISGQDPLTYDVAVARPDELDRWASARDERQRIVAAPRYVSPAMTGYQDLDGYGSWAQTPDAGPAWIPSAVAPDWAPYRYGHWAYVAPWGWTWIDDAPWGFAPFHYGRWARWHDRWAWYPGAVIERPVYAPALVAFVGGPPAAPGFGIGIGVGIGIGAIAAAAWIPLGPHEVYVPPYRHSPAYVQNVNISHVTNVTTITNNLTVNRTVNNFANASAVTVVPASAMASSQPVARAAVAVPPAQLA